MRSMVVGAGSAAILLLVVLVLLGAAAPPVELADGGLGELAGRELPKVEHEAVWIAQLEDALVDPRHVLDCLSRSPVLHPAVVGLVGEGHHARELEARPL